VRAKRLFSLARLFKWLEAVDRRAGAGKNCDNDGMYALSLVDWFGIALWLLAWLAYGAWAAQSSRSNPSLMGTVAHYRRTWMRQAYLRENRITDSALVNSLMHSATFFSSTTVLILGALFAVLGSIERNPADLLAVVKNMTTARQVFQHLLEIKLLLLALVFVYAFLRFTMSLRQFNLINILIGAFPTRAPGEVGIQAERDDPMVTQSAGLNELAGNNFTHGLRAYYFAMPVVLWLVNSWLFIAGTLVITLVTYYMEFHSATVRALSPLAPTEHP
jgi:uncharacterized membrane protein